jgi:SMC interacting uncharacterized protein involved in chromosome segregation
MSIQDFVDLFYLFSYPFCDQLSKSTFYAVGSNQSWPNLLAMLAWMVQLIEASNTLVYMFSF